MTPFTSSVRPLLVSLLAFVLATAPDAQEARRRWERMNQIRRDKFDLVLPEVMRENEIDMWITMAREANYPTLHPDFGHGYISSDGFYVFTDRGVDRIERAALGIGGYLLEENGAYDIVTGNFDLREFVSERDPQRIGVNMAESIGAADGLSHKMHGALIETLGEEIDERLEAGEGRFAEILDEVLELAVEALEDSLMKLDVGEGSLAIAARRSWIDAIIAAEEARVRGTHQALTPVVEMPTSPEMSKVPQRGVTSTRGVEQAAVSDCGHERISSGSSSA